MGMTEAELIRKVELPLAVPTIMGGVRTATINIVATATIAPLAGVLTLGDFIISRNVYGDEGVLAGAICVALLALALELMLAGAAAADDLARTAAAESLRLDSNSTNTTKEESRECRYKRAGARC